jgi:low affinity Fe/Cu permease
MRAAWDKGGSRVVRPGTPCNEETRGEARRLHSEGMHELFRRFAGTTSNFSGSPWAFTIAILVVLMWALTGPVFAFSDTWQLVINTGTTIVTFLMVFLIQNTQNRDAQAMHLKLDELLRAVKEARTELVDLEDLPDAHLATLKDEFRQLREEVSETLIEEVKEEVKEDVKEEVKAEVRQGLRRS